MGGGGAPSDCATLIQDYHAAIEKARACTKGSTNQCSVTSTLSRIGCGCPILVNAKSSYTTLAKQKEAEIQAAHCDTGPICAIACLAIQGAECASAPMTSGTAFVCTGTN